MSVKPTREELIAEANATRTRFIRLSELSDPVTRGMLELWTRKKDDRLMPSPSDLNIAEFARFAPKIFILQVERDPFDLTFRLVGEEVIANFGFNPKGRRVVTLDEELPGLGTLLHEFFRWIVSERRPVGAGGTQDFVDKSYNNYEAVYLPFSADGEHVDRVLAATSYSSNSTSLRRQQAALLPRNTRRA